MMKDNVGDKIDLRAILRLLHGNNGPRLVFSFLQKFDNIKLATEELAYKIHGSKWPSELENLRIDIAEEDKKLKADGIKIYYFFDKDYPATLNLLGNDRPPVLYCFGNLECTTSPCIALIGARAASGNGKKIAHDLSVALGDAGYTTVSGLAVGIDSAAHRASVLHKKPTIAVLGSGIKCVYPKESNDLFDQIGSSGCGAVISEFLPNDQPKPYYFPHRNRIIAGLCVATVVVEATQRSGTMITVGHAMSQGREVFAVPGSILDSRNDGTNFLIKNGARLISSIDSFLEELAMIKENKLHESMIQFELTQPFLKEDDEDFQSLEEKDLSSRIFSLMSYSPISAEFISWDLKVEIEKVLFLLNEFCMAGSVIKTDLGQFVKIA